MIQNSELLALCSVATAPTQKSWIKTTRHPIASSLKFLSVIGVPTTIPFVLALLSKHTSAFRSRTILGGFATSHHILQFLTR